MASPVAPLFLIAVARARVPITLRVRVGARPPILFYFAFALRRYLFHSLVEFVARIEPRAGRDSLRARCLCIYWGKSP